jgi:PhnB protein
MGNAHGLDRTSDHEDEQMKKEESHRTGNPLTVISVMLAVPDAAAAVGWYKKALGATELWNLGSVAGLEIAGAVFFLGEPAGNGWESPVKLGITSARVEVFCDDPDAFIAHAVQAGANGRFDGIKNHEAPWGIHRQGGFIDPFGHIWLVGDKSPLSPFPR